MSLGAVFRRLWDRYGRPISALALLASYILCYVSRPAQRNTDPYGGSVLILLLLLIYLSRRARKCKWPVWLAVALELLSLGWGAFGFFYVCYWSYVLYPPQP